MSLLEFVNGLGIDDEFVACEDPEVVGEGYGLVQVLEEEDHGLKTSSLDACGFLPWFEEEEDGLLAENILVRVFWV